MGQKHWTKQTLYKLMTDVEPALPPDDRRLLHQTFDLSNRLSNLLLHHSPLAMNAAFKTTHDDGLLPVSVLSRKPSERFVGDALFSAYFSVSRLGRLVVRPTSTDSYETMIADDFPSFIQLPVSITRDLSRNDTCPCGSRRKYKRCHGR